jgi:hypothetical protein
MSKLDSYNKDHDVSSVRNDVLTTIGVIAETPDATEEEIVFSLRSLGYKTLRAELLVAFVPLGLARALIKRLPAETPIAVSDHATVLKGDRLLKIRLALVPDFVEALALAEETFTSGIIPREHFSRAVRFSVELDAINQALNAEKTVAKVAPPILLRLGEVLGFEDWYATTRAES